MDKAAVAAYTVVAVPWELRKQMSQGRSDGPNGSLETATAAAAVLLPVAAPATRAQFSSRSDHAAGTGHSQATDEGVGMLDIPKLLDASGKGMDMTNTILGDLINDAPLQQSELAELQSRKPAMPRGIGPPEGTTSLSMSGKGLSARKCAQRSQEKAIPAGTSSRLAAST